MVEEVVQHVWRSYSVDGIDRRSSYLGRACLALQELVIREAPHVTVQRTFKSPGPGPYR